nr:hypothetical protein [Thalassotalea piscium]
MKKVSLVACLVIGLVTICVFFYLPLIHWALDRQLISTENLSVLAKLDKKNYYLTQYHYSEIGDDNWRKSSRYLSEYDGDVAYSLANYYRSLKKVDHAIFRYQQAFELGNLNAAQPLANYYLKQKQWSKSLAIAKTQTQHFWAQALIVNIAISQGSLSEITSIKNQIQQTEQGRALFSTLQKYQVFKPKLPSNIDSKSDCLSLQLFATTLNDLNHASDLISQISKTDVGQYFCFPTPRYITQSELVCQHAADQAITCNEAIWHQYIGSINSQYLGVLVPKGGANVHSGIVYLDRNDDVDVFKHELLHLLGFVDEYPLPKDHPFCHSTQASSHNVVVLDKAHQGERNQIRTKVLENVPWAKMIKSTTPILQKNTTGWQIGTPREHAGEVGLFFVNTCQTDTLISVKPIANATALTYFELPLPPEYKALLSSSVRKYLMPSFHYNISAALDDKGDHIGAQTWRSEAVKFHN